MFEADVRVVSPIPNWNPTAQLRINSGVKIVKPTRWNAVAKTFRERAELVERQRIEGRRVRPGVSPAREVGGIYPPKEDWRSLSDDEFNLLLGITDEVEVASTVQVVSVPKELIARTREMSIPHIREGKYEFDEGLMDIGADHLGPLVELTEAWLADGIIANPIWSMFSLRVGVPGRVMASGWQGLHIDLYGPLVRDQLGSRYNGCRLAINIGDETRYVVFINQRLSTMVRNHPEILDVEERREAIAVAMEERGAQGMIANAFMESFPDYSVVRLTIEPGQAYIAPTPEIPHDGYLVGKKNQDLTLFGSHKGDQTGLPWRPPEYLPAWKDICAQAARDRI